MARATILFVDDEENVRNALRRAMRRADYRLLFADGPESALDLLQKEKVDIVVSDHLMPRMNGLDLLKLIRQRYPEIVRIILTGQTPSGPAVSAVEQGEIYRFLSKPWDEPDMLVTFHLACEKLALERENRRLLGVVRAYESALAQLRVDHPAIAGELEAAADGAGVDLDEPLQASAHAP